jgi:hypothetical protein
LFAQFRRTDSSHLSKRRLSIFARDGVTIGADFKNLKVVAGAG